MLTTVRSFAKDIYTAWSKDNPARLAAALAYYGMFSLGPMLFIALTVAGLFLDQLAVTNEVFDRLAEVLGQDAAQFLQDMVINASQRTSGGTALNTLISLGALLYAATGLFSHLKYSLNIIWHVPPSTQGGVMGFIKTRLLAFVLVLGVGLVLILAAISSVVFSILTSFFNEGTLVLLGNLVGFIALLTFAFAVLYRILPDVELRWRDVWLGAVLTAIAFAIGRWGLGLYLSFGSAGSAFEAAGALAVILISIYYAAQIFLVGAIITRVYATRFGSQVDVASPDAVEETDQPQPGLST